MGPPIYTCRPRQLRGWVAPLGNRLKGPNAPDDMIGVLAALGRNMDRNMIREAIHAAKRKMNMGAVEDLVFDYSGGLWDSRTGEFIGKIWEVL